MLQGRFGKTSGRPYIAARVLIPRLGLAGNVSFVFDTGADSSVLMPSDATNLGVDFSLLENPSESLGIGGFAASFLEPARLVFADSNGSWLYGYEVELEILRSTEYADYVPSLLGRDIIDRWRVTYDKPGGKLTAQVASSDLASQA